MYGSPFTLGLVALLFTACSDTPDLEELKGFAATEHYPEDTFLDTVPDKRAMVVVAHDDDDCAMAGTLARLAAAGWRVQQVSLVAHNDPATGHNAAHLLGAEQVALLEEGPYRLGLDTMHAPYLPIPRGEIDRQFLRDKVAGALLARVNSFRPSVVFTLDNEKGGYGHPEHIFISQLVLDLFLEGSIPAERIYQSVYTDHMEQQIVDTWLKAKMEQWGHPHASTLANELYGIDGMPDPTVQVNVKDQASRKMAYLRAYPEEVRRNLRKFIPYYEAFDAEDYFGIFDREFFRVIERPT